MLARGAESWQSSLLSCITQSTTKVEYVVATKACKVAICLYTLVTDVEIKFEMLQWHCDSHSVI